MIELRITLRLKRAIPTKIPYWTEPEIKAIVVLPTVETETVKRIAAKAKQIDAVVVTAEKYKPNSAQLPNVCASIDVPTMSFDDFMGEFIK